MLQPEKTSKKSDEVSHDDKGTENNRTAEGQ